MLKSTDFAVAVVVCHLAAWSIVAVKGFAAVAVVVVVVVDDDDDGDDDRPDGGVAAEIGWRGQRPRAG